MLSNLNGEAGAGNSINRWLRVDQMFQATARITLHGEITITVNASPSGNFRFIINGTTVLD